MANRQPAHSRQTNRASTVGRVQGRLAQHRRVARSSLQQLLKSPASTGMTVAVIAIALVFPALFGVINANLLAWSGGTQIAATLTVYLQANVSDAETEAVSDYLLTHTNTGNLAFVSAQQAMEEFSATHSLGSLLQQLPANPLPAAFVLELKPDSIAQVDELVAEIESQAGVDLVQYDRLWIERLRALSDLVAAITAMLGVLVAAGLVAIVGNTIRLAVGQRRQEIRVVKLIGGSDAHIARPFLYSGLLLGLAGGIAANILLSLMMAYLGTALAELSQLYGESWHLRGPGVTTFLLVTVAGAASGWVAALMASYRTIAAIDD